MIQYTLKCSQGHRFDSWFQSAEAFDKLASAGMIACAVCGDAKVEKSIMAPAVRPARKAATAPVVAEAQEKGTQVPGSLSQPASPAEQALAEMRRKVEENSDYVGVNFATEARAIHDGDAPERPIYGEAKLEDARALVEDGIPVAPLPFRPQRKSN